MTLVGAFERHLLIHRNPEVVRLPRLAQEAVDLGNHGFQIPERRLSNPLARWSGWAFRSPGSWGTNEKTKNGTMTIDDEIPFSSGAGKPNPFTISNPATRIPRVP